MKGVMVVLVISVGLALAMSGCANNCAKAYERAQACMEEVCAAGNEAHELCGAELPVIENCIETASNASAQAVEADTCMRVLNLYSTALTLSR